MRRADERGRYRRAGRFAEDRHVPRIAAEGCDVGLHPFQSRHRIHQRLIARRGVSRLLRQLGMREEPERAEPVIERDDDRALTGKRFAVAVRARARAFGVRATEDPEHDRTPLGWRLCGRPDVQIQAVLARGW